MSIDYSKYKFRCSQLGKIMTGISVGLTENQEATFIAYDARYKGNGKPLTPNQVKDYFELGAKKFGKKVGLSTTAINYLREIHKETLFSRNKEIKNKFLDKGIQVEEYSISIYSRVNKTLVLNNRIRLENEFITGETDNTDQVAKMVREFKSSWDYSTFPFLDEEIPNSDYEWQIEGYLNLTGMETGELNYVLVDTPFKIIDDELRRLDWKHQIFTLEGDINKECIPLVVETVTNLIYTQKGLNEYCNISSNVYREWFNNFKEIPEDMRVKTFKVIPDENKIAAVYNQIKLCREYLNELSGFTKSQSLKKIELC